MKFNKEGYMYYFSYGSNLNKEQMLARCPGAIPVYWPVFLNEHKIVFRSNGRGLGVANIEKEKGQAVPGVLWKITPECLAALDRYEGYPWLYDRKMFTIENLAGEEMNVMSYYMVCDPLVKSPPSSRYFNVIKEGYINFELNLNTLLEFRKGH